MPLTEVTVIDKIEVLPESGAIQVRRAHRIMDGDTVVTTVDYQRVAYPRDADLSAEDAQVQAIAAAAWAE